MPTYDFEAPVPYGDAQRIVSCPKVLDAVHGHGLWKFSPWEEDASGELTRKGWIKGVEVPSFARVFVGGSKYITCKVHQRYTTHDDCITIHSTLKPKVAGAHIATNATDIRITPVSDGCRIEATSSNATSLPGPLGPMAIEVMDQMSDETMEFLEEALQRIKS